MKSFLENTWKHRAHVVMALPAFLILFFIMYVPMAGLVMAFKNFDFSKGIWGSPWCGLDNFKFLLASKNTFINMTRNTLLYYLLFTALGTFLNVVLAIAIDQFLFKKMAKTMQTIMIIPVFISYAAVQFIVYAFISTDTGIINNAMGANIRFYSTASWWPLILTIVKMWKDVGYGSVLYMSVLAGIDTELYEAAQIDGANRFQRLIYITLPALANTIITVFILNLAKVMNLFESVFVTASDSVMKVAQVLQTYIYNKTFGASGASNSDYGYSTAVGLFKSFVGMVLVLGCNWASKKVRGRGIV